MATSQLHSLPAAWVTVELQGCLNGLSIFTIITTMTPCVPPADGFQEMMEPVPERSCPGPTLCCRAQGCVAESRDGGCHTQPLPGNPSATPASPPALPASRLTAEQWQPPSCWNPILPLCAATYPTPYVVPIPSFAHSSPTGTDGTNLTFHFFAPDEI